MNLRNMNRIHPKWTTERKQAPPPKKKKKKLNRTLAICRKIKKKKRIIRIPDGEKKTERLSEEIRPEISPNLVKG